MPRTMTVLRTPLTLHCNLFNVRRSVNPQYQGRLWGHAVQGTIGKLYSHRTPHGAAKCREASNLVEEHWRIVVHS